MRVRLAIALALCAALCACGRSVPQQDAPSALWSQSRGTTPAFLSQIADAPFQTAYFARRHVWQSYEEANGPEILEYTERVWSDGQGHFSVTPEQILQPALTAHAEQIFLLVQKAREGFIYRLRDFRIQELDSFLHAYRIEDMDQQVSVAGQACERLRIHPANRTQGYWEIDVEPSSGLILSTREFLENGALVSSVDTIEFQANPDLSGVALHEDLLAVPFTPQTAKVVLGFTPLQPSFLPRGFSLVRSEKITQGSANWVRACYSDGGETLFLLYRCEELEHTTDGEPGGPGVLKIFRAGRWTVAQASYAEHEIIAIGREPATILQQVIESCLH